MATTDKLTRYWLDLTWDHGEDEKTTKFLLSSNEVFPFLKGRFAESGEMIQLIEEFESNRTIPNLPSRVYAMLSHLNRLSTNVHYRGIVRGESRDHDQSN